jgi:hypothetical protein
MAFSHRDVIVAQSENLEADRIKAVARYEHARVSEDNHETMAAADWIVEIDAKRAALDRIANQFVAAQQAQPRQNAYGLSDTEVEIARNSHSGGTAEQRLEQYARNKQRLQHMRATGEYRDDQGTVKR